MHKKMKIKTLHELFKRKPLMTTLKHSCKSLSGVYEQECIERTIPLKHPLCLKLQKMTFQSPKRYKDKINFFRCPFFAINRMNLTREHSLEKYKNMNSSLNIPLLSTWTIIIAQLLKMVKMLVTTLEAIKRRKFSLPKWKNFLANSRHCYRYEFYNIIRWNA